MIGRKCLIVLSSASVLLLGALIPVEAEEVRKQALIDKLESVKNQDISNANSQPPDLGGEQANPTIRNYSDFAQISESVPSNPQTTTSPEIQPHPLPDANASMEQVTNVSQLRDVEPTDWAYEALRNLVERYGCIAGYPDGSFRGNRAMTRYEFAAGLNACLEQIGKLIAEGTANIISRDDLVQVQRLNDEFAAELATLRGRVDNLEVRTAVLESQQFSTTAIIGGEAIFALSTATGGDPPGTGNANTTFNYLTRLQLVSSFSGKDRLRMELSAGNFERFGFGNPNVLNTNTALLSFQAETDDRIALSMVEYRFPAFGDRVVFTLRPVGFSLSSVLSANSPYFDTGRGAISRFAELNPVFRIGNLDAGVGMDWLMGNRARLQIAYGANNGSNPGNGFFLGEGAHATGIQFVLLPADNVLTGITYVYGYSPDGRLNTFTGSAIADSSGFINQSSNIHAVSGTLQWRISPKFTFSTWGGVVGTYAAKTDAFAVSTNFMFALGISDLLQEGSLLALMFGQPPKLAKVGDFSVASGLGEDASSFHIEAFYRFRLNDNIFITPGFFIVTNPGNIENNNDIFVGTIRTTLRF
ncbi:MAG: iron uptake porin [Calothrix sp. MO_192.B10]|nr:iron uptake porin [Calothrix sp. MO_192.B10]